MIFVDANVIMYAVGRPHPLREEARGFFEHAAASPGVRLLTSVEVLQELMHAYIPVNRIETLDAALDLATARMDEIQPVATEDVTLARALLDPHPGLSARDLLHLAFCSRRQVEEIKTFDRVLDAAFRKR